MRRIWILAVCALLLLAGAGCAPVPTVTQDGEAWSEDWVTVGTTLGIEAPGNGFTLLDNKDALAAANLFYAAWTAGGKTDYINQEGETVDLYEAQLYLLLSDCKDEASAQGSVEEWMGMQTESYSITETKTVTCAGQPFTLLIYDGTGADNPYQFGVSAFGVYQNHAINAELTCQDTFQGDALELLTQFLDGIHYAP